MSVEELPVVRIRSDAPGHKPDGFVEINAADYDPAIHRLFDAPAKAPTEQPSKGAKAPRKE